MYLSEEQTWRSAEDTCRSRTGHLVTFADVDELIFVLRFLTRPGSATNVFPPLWVGISAEKSTDVPDSEELQWRWVTGRVEPHPSALLATLRPTEERCGFLDSLSSAYISLTVDCRDRKRALCEAPPL
ncbi:uncharacterized protein LOC108676839 [Hyalella azteca]|uniref:Uncharacterized protein LOC108676839 n=1 Tax=Hyalella azteca TaxID=294128 RepID=A0A8B7P5W6_HYAAZ|nr:uncharacterized protein LOC108676839 [Hyalella azteca]